MPRCTLRLLTRNNGSEESDSCVLVPGSHCLGSVVVISGLIHPSRFAPWRGIRNVEVRVLFYLLSIRGSLFFMPQAGQYAGLQASSKPSNKKLKNASLVSSTTGEMMSTIRQISSNDLFDPFTAPACKISGLKSAHIHACKRHI